MQLLKDFATAEHNFVLADFRDSYTPLQWAAITGQLREVGFSQVRVFLGVELSDAMKQYIAARDTPLSVPAEIVE